MSKRGIEHAQHAVRFGIRRLFARGLLRCGAPFLKSIFGGVPVSRKKCDAALAPGTRKKDGLIAAAIGGKSGNRPLWLFGVSITDGQNRRVQISDASRILLLL